MLAYKHLLISAKHKVQLRLMGTSLVLQVFGHKVDEKSEHHQRDYNSSRGGRECLNQISCQTTKEETSGDQRFIVRTPWISVENLTAIHPIHVEIFQFGPKQWTKREDITASSIIVQTRSCDLQNLLLTSPWCESHRCKRVKLDLWNRLLWGEKDRGGEGN